jgi:hypothetical protein
MEGAGWCYLGSWSQWNQSVRKNYNHGNDVCTIQGGGAGGGGGGWCYLGSWSRWNQSVCKNYNHGEITVDIYR